MGKIMENNKKENSDNINKKTFNKELALKSLEKSLSEREFYTFGYLKSLGIMLFTLLSMSLSVVYFCYAFFIYEPPVSYVALNPEKRMFEEVPLTQLHIEVKELEQWANDAVTDIMSWNYLSYDAHGVKVSKYFFESEIPKFMTIFNNLYLQKMVRSQQAIVIPEMINVFKVEKEVMWQDKKAFILEGSMLLKIYGRDGMKTLRYFITVAISREKFSNKQDGLSILKIDFNTERSK